MNHILESLFIFKIMNFPLRYKKIHYQNKNLNTKSITMRSWCKTYINCVLEIFMLSRKFTGTRAFMKEGSLKHIFPRHYQNSSDKFEILSAFLSKFLSKQAIIHYLAFETLIPNFNFENENIIIQIEFQNESTSNNSKSKYLKFYIRTIGFS